MENNSKKEADSNVEAELNKSEDKNFEKSVEQKLKEAELNKSEDKKPEISVEQKLKEILDIPQVLSRIRKSKKKV